MKEEEGWAKYITNLWFPLWCDFFNEKRLTDSGCGKFAKMFTQKRFTTAVEARRYYVIFKKHMHKNRLNQILEAKKIFKGLTYNSLG